MMNSTSSVLLKYWENVIEHFGIPFSRYCVRLYYSIYAHFIIFNVMVFLIKYVPMGIYMFKFIKNTHVASRERLKMKRMDEEDIQLQIHILNTKLKLRDAEFSERANLLRRKVEQLSKARNRVQEIIAANDEVRDAIRRGSRRGDEPNCNFNGTPEEESNIFVELLKELKYDQGVVSDQEEERYAELPAEGISAENGVYSSAQDDKDYHVKIVKVTNVYKVTYLRHFIKQKKLRRANKQALLRKKMEKIKKLFDEWQNALQMVINNKVSLVNMETRRLEIASREAMGDYLKPHLNNSFDSDSDCRNSADGYQDEYCIRWAQNQYGPVFNDDLNMNIEARRECYDLEECFNKHSSQEVRGRGSGAEILFIVPEETSSQVEIEEIKSEIE